MHLRRAHPEEAAQLTHLCFRSKAHWGYDDVFIAQARDALTVGAKQIEAGAVWVAETDCNVIGMVALVTTDDPALVDLDKLFVEPSRIGTGTGRALMNFAVEEARRRGYARMAILADRNAAEFYARMGAVYVEERPSDAIPGRLLPYLELKL